MCTKPRSTESTKPITLRVSTGGDVYTGEPSPQGTPEVLPSPILRRLSSTSDSRAALRRAAGCSSGLPQRAKGAARAVGAVWSLAGAAGEDAAGGAAQKELLVFLAAYRSAGFQRGVAVVHGYTSGRRERKFSRRSIMPVRMRVLTVPRGCPSAAAISLWLKSE